MRSDSSAFPPTAAAEVRLRETHRGERDTERVVWSESCGWCVRLRVKHTASPHTADVPYTPSQPAAAVAAAVAAAASSALSSPAFTSSTFATAATVTYALFDVIEPQSAALEPVWIAASSKAAPRRQQDWFLKCLQGV